MSARKTMVTLVHGTWARDAAWTQEGSALCAALDRRDYAVERIPWHAGNRYTDRRDGARVLRDHIERHPQFEHVIVAHSHGGNVAIRALDGDDCLVKGLICLNTPFLNVLGRYTGIFSNIGMAVALAAWCIPLGLGLRQGPGWALLLLGLAILVLLSVIAVLFPIFQEWTLKRGQKFQFRALERTPIYCLSTPDDEAYGGLAFVAALQNFLFLAISAPVLVNRPIGALIGGLVLFEVLPFMYLPWDWLTGGDLYTRELYVALVSDFDPEHPWRPLFALGHFVLLYFVAFFYYYALYAVVVLLVLALLSVLVTTSQGMFAPLSGVFNRFLVTLVPLGSVNTRFEEIKGDGTPLRHSALYNDEMTISRITDWIGCLEQARSPGDGRFLEPGKPPL